MAGRASLDVNRLAIGAGPNVRRTVSMKVKEWIGPALTVLVPLAMGGIHMEMKVAENAATNTAILQRLDRIERTLDSQRVAALQYERDIP